MSTACSAAATRRCSCRRTGPRGIRAEHPESGCPIAPAATGVDRLVPLANANTSGATGWCLEVHDLALSKLVAGRDKDLDFVRVLVRERMADPALLEERVTRLPDPGGVRDLARSRLSQVLRSTW